MLKTTSFVEVGHTPGKYEAVTAKLSYLFIGHQRKEVELGWLKESMSPRTIDHHHHLAMIDGKERCTFCTGTPQLLMVSLCCLIYIPNEEESRVEIKQAKPRSTSDRTHTQPLAENAQFDSTRWRPWLILSSFECVSELIQALLRQPQCFRDLLFA